MRWGGQQTFSTKGHTVNTWGFLCRPNTLSVTSILAKHTSVAVFQYGFIYGRCNVMFTLS